jgi:GTP-binding protein
VDTAGFVVKRSEGRFEFYFMRSVRAIEHSDICILIIDATRGFERIKVFFGWLKKNRKGVVILVNKWDLVEKRPCQQETMKKIREELMPFTDVPIFCISFNKTTIIESLEATVKCSKAEHNVSLHQNSTNT